MIKKDINQQSWIEKSNAIIESIADEFDCVCYVDLSKSPEEDDVEIFQRKLLFPYIIVQTYRTFIIWTKRMVPKFIFR